MEQTSKKVIIKLDKGSYAPNEIVNIDGSGANGGATVTMSIFNELGEKVTTLNVNAKSNGVFSTIWVIPADSISGNYEIIVDDGLENTTIEFSVN